MVTKRQARKVEMTHYGAIGHQRNLLLLVLLEDPSRFVRVGDQDKSIHFDLDSIGNCLCG